VRAKRRAPPGRHSCNRDCENGEAAVASRHPRQMRAMTRAAPGRRRAIACSRSRRRAAPGRRNADTPSDRRVAVTSSVASRYAGRPGIDAERTFEPRPPARSARSAAPHAAAPARRTCKRLRPCASVKGRAAAARSTAPRMSAVLSRRTHRAIIAALICALQRSSAYVISGGDRRLLALLALALDHLLAACDEFGCRASGRRARCRTLS